MSSFSPGWGVQVPPQQHRWQPPPPRGTVPLELRLTFPCGIPPTLKCCASGTGIHQTPLVKVPSASLQITGYNSMKSLGNASPCGARGTQQTLELHQNLIHYTGTGMHHMGNVKCSGTKPSLGVLRTGGAVAR